MTTDDIQNSLGRIEQKVDSLQDQMGERLGRLDNMLFDRIEPRMRNLENDMAVVKTKASMVSAMVAVVVAALFNAAGWVLKKI